VTRVYAVARREYLERVRSKAFVVSTILGPTLLAGFMLVPILLTGHRGGPLRIVVFDESGALAADVTTSLTRRRVANEPRFVIEPPPAGPIDVTRASVQEQVARGELDGYLFLSKDALEQSAAEYYGRNVSNVMDLDVMNKAVEEALVSRRLSREGLDPERVRALTRGVEIKRVRVTARGAREDRGVSRILVSLVLMMLLYTTLAVWGAAVMNGVIEEKTSRVVEVVVSSLSSSQLFAGKLLGVGAAGLTQFVIWAACLAAINTLGAGGLGVVRALPELSPPLLVAFVLFFLLGYFLYGSMYASIGAAVNTTQEAQSLVFPVMMPLILSVVFYPMVLSAPDSTLSVVLSLVPFFAPLLMFLRMTAVSPPAWQVALSMLLMLATIAGITWAAARIYRVGILMYGKRPTFPEIIRWVGRS
jgi:ABC-2 type transport system permease protein